MGKISKAISAGLSMFKLRKATADASQVLEGSTFYSGNKELKKESCRIKSPTVRF